MFSSTATASNTTTPRKRMQSFPWTIPSSSSRSKLEGRIRRRGRRVFSSSPQVSTSSNTTRTLYLILAGCLIAGTMNEYWKFIQQIVSNNSLYNNHNFHKNFNYSQPAVRNHWTLSEPSVFIHQTVVIMVFSARENSERRTWIRKTWGERGSVYFIISGPEQVSNKSTTPPFQVALQQEQTHHHDILDTIHPDGPAAFPHKLRFAYEWLLDKMPEVQWILKVDDDMAVRIDTLEHVFLKQFNPRIPMVVSCIKQNDQNLNLSSSSSSSSIIFMQGSCGHVVSQPVARCIVENKKELFKYHSGDDEDISLGIWLDQANCKASWLDSIYFVDTSQCLQEPWLISGHFLTVADMKVCNAQASKWHDEQFQQLS